MLPTIAWMRGRNGGNVKLIDQRKLPGKETYITCTSYKQTAHAIKTLAIRGAPAIGVAAGYGIALAARNFKGSNPRIFSKYMSGVFSDFAETRPTAVNLFWAINRMKKKFSTLLPLRETHHRHTLKQSRIRIIREIQDRLLHEAKLIEREDLAMNGRLSELGSLLMPKKGIVLTYCNTGGLATAGIGTALGVIERAFRKGRRIHVYSCETRPVLQGLRLTIWELKRYGIPYTAIADNMAASQMAKGIIKCVIVGADRIAGNGDTANKIGTYSLAVLAKHHKIPFYVAAPSSSIDSSLKNGSAIQIEERDRSEITDCYIEKFRPAKLNAINPAFDVTPSSLITSIITEKGIFKHPYKF